MLGRWQLLGAVERILSNLSGSFPSSQVLLEPGVHPGGAVVVQSLPGPPAQESSQPGTVALTHLTPGQPLPRIADPPAGEFGSGRALPTLATAEKLS